ncbi:hypothetical protein Tco_0497115 [Tanacetum coccineum]
MDRNLVLCVGLCLLWGGGVRVVLGGVIVVGLVGRYYSVDLIFMDGWYMLHIVDFYCLECSLGLLVWNGQEFFIMNCDAPAVTSASAKGHIPSKAAKQKLARKNELKAKNTLLLAIPDEHLLKFHGIKDAKTLWEATKARFRGNKESMKMQKTILKQQYENFAA